MRLGGRPALDCTPLLPLAFLWPLTGVSRSPQTDLHHVLEGEVRIPASTSAFGTFSSWAAVFPGTRVLPGLGRWAPALRACLFPGTQGEPPPYLFPGRGPGSHLEIPFGLRVGVRTHSSLQSEPGSNTGAVCIQAPVRDSRLGSGSRTYSRTQSEKQASTATRGNGTHTTRPSWGWGWGSLGTQLPSDPPTWQEGWIFWCLPGQPSARSLPWIFLGTSAGPSSALEE